MVHSFVLFVSDRSGTEWDTTRDEIGPSALVVQVCARLIMALVDSGKPKSTSISRFTAEGRTDSVNSEMVRIRSR